MQKTLTKLTMALAISSAIGVTNAATLEEVVVVAQKRAQSLQDVPVSVAAVDADKISDAGIVDLQGLSDYVPNFSINETGISTTITVRGISSGINSGFEQSVGMYNDGIFYGRDQLARTPMFDMERVEILRGPQGILYGKNSIAGAVSQITAKPTEDFEGSITGLYETEHGEQDLRLVLSGPLAEGLSGRLAILDRSLDGYIFNTVSKQDEQQEDEQVIRASLRWDINEDITANFKTSRAIFDTLGRNLEVYNSTGHIAALNALQTDVKVEGELNYSGSMNESDSDNEVNNTTLSVDWQLDGLTFTSVTGFVDYEFDELCDCDFTGAEIFNATRDEKYSQFSQEFRFTSELGNTVDYIGGLFFQKTDLDYGDTINLTDPTVLTQVLEGSAKKLEDTADNAAMVTALAAANGKTSAEIVGILDDKAVFVRNYVKPLAAGASTARKFDQDGDVLALFAQATWSIADNLRLTAGGRYSKESKDASRSQQHFKKDGTAVAVKSVTTADDAHKYNTLFGAFGIEPYEKFNDKLDDESFTPLVSVQWDADDQTMLYATWTQGYKSGGFDARSNAHWDKDVKNAQQTNEANPVQSKELTGSWTFDREKANSYELGSKMVLADGAVELNLALYLTEYKDLQVSQFDGTLGFNVTNAGEATVQGLEADGRWAVTDNVILTGSAAYLDFNYDKFPNSECYFGQASSYAAGHEYAGLCDAAGKRKEYTPEFQANVGAVWSGQVAEGYHLDAGMDLIYMDEYIYAANLDPKAVQDAFTLLNARISLANLDDTWEVALIGRNLTDETAINFGGNTPLASTLTGGTGNSYYGFVNRPRNIALQGVYRF
jgi:outer membrane receptor protein involved in Fe transport